MRAEGIIAKGELRARLDFQPCSIAVIPLWRRVNLKFAGNFELCRPAQRLFENGSLDLQLVGIIGVLIVTPPAAAKIRAARDDAVGRRLEHGFEPSPGETGLFLDDCRFDLLAFEDKRN